MSLWWGLQEGPEEDSEDWVVEAELEAVEMFIVTRRERKKREMWCQGDETRGMEVTDRCYHWPSSHLSLKT